MDKKGAQNKAKDKVVAKEEKNRSKSKPKTEKPEKIKAKEIEESSGSEAKVKMRSRSGYIIFTTEAREGAKKSNPQMNNKELITVICFLILGISSYVEET